MAKPRFVSNIATGETGWFSSPGLVDLTATAAWRSSRRSTRRSCSTPPAGCSARARRRRAGSTRRASSPTSTATDARDRCRRQRGYGRRLRPRPAALRVKPGWPASTCSGGQCPEARGMAAADLDGDGRIEVVVTTTNTSNTGSQVFVFEPGGLSPARPRRWPRFNADDAAFNGAGNHGYGAYGENVGFGNLDDDPQLEIVVTFDNHQINLFNHDGTSVLASPWYTNRQNDTGRRSAGASSSAGWTRASRPATTTATPAPGRTCAARRGFSGRPHRRRSPTSTATAATRSSACRTSRTASRTARRRTRSWCSTARRAAARARRAGTAASRRR